MKCIPSDNSYSHSTIELDSGRKIHVFRQSLSVDPHGEVFEADIHGPAYFYDEDGEEIVLTRNECDDVANEMIRRWKAWREKNGTVPL